MPDVQIEEIRAITGGQVDTLQIDLLRPIDAQVMQNMHHDRLALERRQGMTQIGNATPDLVCFGGFHFRLSTGQQQIVRAQSTFIGVAQGPTYLYRGTGSIWLGAHSGLNAAVLSDVIGNGAGLGPNGTFVQYADKLYYYDGGTAHKLYTSAVIQDYGIYAGATLPAGVAEAKGGNGGSTNYSLVLNGSTYVSAGVTGISGATNYTFSIWVKMAVGYTSESGLIWAWFGLSAPHNAGLHSNNGGNKVLLESFENNSYVKAHSTQVIADGNWHLITGVRTGNQGQLYIDGQLEDTSTFPSSALQSTVLYMGVRRLNAGPENFLTGSIDDARFYARALSSAEIVDLNNGVEPDSTGLKGWWKMNEGIGSTVSDSSGTGNNGTITGTASWAIDSPDASVGGGNTGFLQEGDYKFVYTYYNPTTAEESPPSEESNVVTFGLPNGTLVVTIPVNSAWALSQGFTIVRIYRTTANGAAFLFDKAITISSLPATAELSQADEYLGAEVEYTRGEIPKLRYCILYNEMIIGAGNPSEPSKLYWSAVGDPTHWPPQNAQDIDKDNGDPITGLFRLLGRLYVLKQTSGVYMLTPQFDSEGNVSFSVDALTTDFGCLSHHSIVVIDTYAYWADAKGVCRFNGQQVENISDAKVRYRYKQLVQQIVYDPTWVNGYRAPALEAMAVHDRQPDHNYYRLNLRSYYLEPQGTTYDKHVELIYDLNLQCWFEDQGQFGALATTGANIIHNWLYRDRQGQYHVMSGDETGRAYRRRTRDDSTTVYADNGQAIESKWKSKWFGGMDGVVPQWLEIEYERSEVGYSLGPVSVMLYRDGKTDPDVTDSTSFIPYATNSPPPPRDSTLPDPTRISHNIRIGWNSEWCRRFCFEIYCNAINTQLRILQMRVAYIPCGSQLKAK